VEQGQISSVSAEEEVVPVSRVKELEKRVYELERAMGRKSLENDVLKEAVRIGREK
jgi:transposase